MAHKQPVVGQRYRNVRSTLRNAEWILSQIFTGTDGVEYGALVSASDRTAQKTLSLVTIGDPSQFALVDTPATPA
jgi:hypothetical protein